MKSTFLDAFSGRLFPLYGKEKEGAELKKGEKEKSESSERPYDRPRRKRGGTVSHVGKRKKRGKKRGNLSKKKDELLRKPSDVGRIREKCLLLMRNQKREEKRDNSHWGGEKKKKARSLFLLGGSG